MHSESLMIKFRFCRDDEGEATVKYKLKHRRPCNLRHD